MHFPRSSTPARKHALLSLPLAALVAVGCAASHSSNQPLERYDPGSGYRASTAQGTEIGEIGFIASFSGGGTRAAALAYGVMQELRDTPIRSGGEGKRLLDEIDVITSVSGGSFTAAYYGLRGDRLFDDFESRFLRRNVTRDIFLRLLLPHNWLKLLTPFYDRTDVAIDYYDKKIFDRATYRDMASADGPFVEVNSTDLSAGARFTFVQSQFDLICSDLDEFRVAEAVTASSAVPVAFPAIVLSNYSGQCGYEEPAWLEQALTQRKQAPRRFHIASELTAYRDREDHPYLHLVDGGIADNLGVRGPLDQIIVSGGLWERLHTIGEKPPRHLVFLVVNASTEPARPFRKIPKPPPLGDLIGSMTDTQLHRFNFETMALLENAMRDWAGIRDSDGEPVRTHLIDIAQYAIEDPEDRAFYNTVPTSLDLDDETVDRLIAIGRRLVRDSPEYRELVAALR